jgi:hypothetical protein
MRTPLGRTAIASCLAALAIAAFGCGSTPKSHVRTGRTRPTLHTDNPAAAPVKNDGPELLPARTVAQLDDDNAAPYLARRGDEALLFYASKGRFYTRLLGADGTPKAEAVAVGPAPNEMPLAYIEAVGDGYLVAWVEGLHQNATIKALALDAKGNARGVPATLAQSAEEVGWIEVLPNKDAALVLWDVPERSDVVVAPFVPGKGASAPIVVAHDVLDWDAVATPSGAAVATVVEAPAGDKAAAAQAENKVGRVLLSEIDASGKVAPPVTVNAEPTAQSDVVLVLAGDSYLCAWTDTREIDASVFVAAVGRGGKIIAAPRRATAPVGEQALVALVADSPGPSGPGSKRALIAWEDMLRAPRAERLIHLASVGPDGSLGAERATLLFSASGPPDFAVDGDGFAAVTLAPATSGEGATPKDAPIWPAFVRFGPDLAVRAAEPVRAEPFARNEHVPALTRGLSCHGGTCTTLASTEGQPSTLALVALPVRKSVWRAPAWRDPDDVPPRSVAVSALYDGDHLARVAATEIPGGMLSAWVTYFIEDESAAKKGKKPDETLATLGVRPIAADGKPGAAQILSRRALSIGGVALAAAPGGKAPESALAWASREKTEAQVMITKLGEGGQKLAQKPLTTVARKPSKAGLPSEVSDVAIAYAPPTTDKGTDDGWIVAWADTRDGNAEIYVARVDRTLRKVVQDKRITEAPGDSAEVQIAVRGKETFLVWSDARQNPEEGNGDIHAVRLDTRTLQKIGPETRLFSSPGHSRSPAIALAGEKLVVAWVEEAAAETQAEAGARVALLDERGALTGAPQLVRGEEGSPVTSVALACEGARCRGVLTSALRGETMVLDAFELSPGAAPGALKPLAALTGGVTTDVSPAFAGSSATALFFGDDAVGGSGRVRFMTIAWPK